MKKIERAIIVEVFSKLGVFLRDIGQNKDWSGYSLGITESEYLEFDQLVKKQVQWNGWFTEDSVRLMCVEIGAMLEEENLKKFVSSYSYTENPKKIGLIFAGNIPLVGFHDFLCVLLSGNIAVCKLSSNDKTLFPAIVKLLSNFSTEIGERIIISEGKLGEVAGIIATGSNNSMGYFESYFGHLPHIFRKNRTSIAILDGSETKEELKSLGKDIFTYYGLGCRNVSKLMIPKDFELNRFFEAILDYSSIVNHHKYANNYDYNKAIHLMNLEQILDNGFVLLKESEELFSPLAMIYYQRYSDKEEVEAYLNSHKEDVQAIVGKDYITYGEAQCPAISDFADGVDTMLWLSNLS